MRRRKTGYWLSCVLAALILLVSGFSHSFVQDVSSIGSSRAIASGPSIGPQNILLMGLEKPAGLEWQHPAREHPVQAARRKRPGRGQRGGW